MSRAPHGLSLRPWVLSLVAVVVCGGWAVNLVAGMVGWQNDPGVNAIMGALLALIGTVWGKSLFARPTDEPEDEEDTGETPPRRITGRHRRPDPEDSTDEP